MISQPGSVNLWCCNSAIMDLSEIAFYEKVIKVKADVAAYLV
jgi:hypothetical protein